MYFLSELLPMSCRISSLDNVVIILIDYLEFTVKEINKKPVKTGGINNNILS